MSERVPPAPEEVRPRAGVQWWDEGLVVARPEELAKPASAHGSWPLSRPFAVLAVVLLPFAAWLGVALAERDTAPPAAESVDTAAAAADNVDEPDPTPPPVDSPLPSAPAPPQPQTPPIAEPAALDVARTLPVKGRAQANDYDRDLFGPAWTDVDRNGCDTRNDVLRRDLTDVVLKADTDGCAVATGTLHDPYGGAVIAFQRGAGTSSQVQIDHVVALADAWQKGAREWPAERRETFANDPLNLLAVDGPLNQQKGAGDAATWLPPDRGYWCAYAARIVAVKHSYGLSVTAAEGSALVAVLMDCPGEPLPL